MQVVGGEAFSYGRVDVRTRVPDDCKWVQAHNERVYALLHDLKDGVIGQFSDAYPGSQFMADYREILARAQTQEGTQKVEFTTECLVADIFVELRVEIVFKLVFNRTAQDLTQLVGLTASCVLDRLNDELEADTRFDHDQHDLAGSSAPV